MSENAKTLIPGCMYNWVPHTTRTSFIVPSSDPSKENAVLLFSKRPFMYLESKILSPITRTQFWFLFVDEDNSAPHKGYLFMSDLDLITPVSL